MIYWLVTIISVATYFLPEWVDKKIPLIGLVLYYCLTGLHSLYETFSVEKHLIFEDQNGLEIRTQIVTDEPFYWVTISRKSNKATSKLLLKDGQVIPVETAPCGTPSYKIPANSLSTRFDYSKFFTAKGAMLESQFAKDTERLMDEFLKLEKKGE